MGKSFKKVLINDERDDFLLEVRNLSKRYGEKQAIDSISFSIEGKQAVRLRMGMSSLMGLMC